MARDRCAPAPRQALRRIAAWPGTLDHSRASGGLRQPTDPNALTDEYLRLAYRGWRAQHQGFTAALATAYAPGPGPVPAVPQALGQALLNLFTNAFYAVAEKAKTAGSAYRPEVRVATGRCGAAVWLRVRDNGPGLVTGVHAKIFQPFLTPAPAPAGACR